MKIFKSIDGRQRNIIILHDTFLYKGGGERLILMMAKALDADIASGFFSRGSFNLRDEGFNGKMIEVSSEIFKKGFRHIKLKQAFLFNTGFLKEYDTVIFSGDCLSAVRNTGPDTRKIYYCHTPPRYLYDLKQEYLKKLNWYLKPAFGVISMVFKNFYERDISKFTEIVCNSKNTASRLKHFTGRDASVLYPPVELEKFTYQSTGDYYLSFARLSSAKRVDNIVKAFSQMPDKKLIVIYGVNDPQKEEIFALGKGAANIKFVTCPGNEGFYDYIGNAIANIYIPIDEDFGMSPVESMAAGKPVIGVDEGGIKESIIQNETGVLIPEGGFAPDIIEAVNYLTPEIALSMREGCEQRAADFSYENFEKQIQEMIS